jgi:hypothetical protein
MPAMADLQEAIETAGNRGPPCHAPLLLLE